MGIVIGLDSRLIEVQGDEIVIGRSPTAQISIPGDERLAERHAVLRLVAGRWLIEAQGDAAVRVGDGRPSKVSWLNPDDVIDLTESGPQLRFCPTQAPIGSRSGGPAVAAVPSVPTGAKGLVAALSGAVVVLAVFVVWFGVKPSGKGSSQVDPPTLPAPVLEPEPPIAVASQVAAPRQWAPAVYVVLMQNPKGKETQRVGTACAVGGRRLVTSADVVQLIKRTGEQYPLVFVQAEQNSFSAKVVKAGLHPEFQKLHQISFDAANELMEAQESRETLEAEIQDEAGLKNLQQRLAQAQKRLQEAEFKKAYFDLGLLEVDQDLPLALEVSESDSAVAPGEAVHMYRLQLVNHDHHDHLISPDKPLETQIVLGSLRKKIPLEGSNARHWLVRFGSDVHPFDVKKLGDVWFGSPVVSETGEVIGVYCGAMPQDSKLKDAHLVTGVGPLSEIELDDL